jgi:hypothetical protein
MILYEEPQERHMCPVTFFLSLAFADQAFQDLVSYNDLATARPVAGSSLYRATYKPNALQRPVMRGMATDRTISDDRIWTYDCFSLALKGAGQRASYQENVTSYCFRRGFARAVESKYLSSYKEKY